MRFLRNTDEKNKNRKPSTHALKVLAACYLVYISYELGSGVLHDASLNMNQQWFYGAAMLGFLFVAVLLIVHTIPKREERKRFDAVESKVNAGSSATATGNDETKPRHEFQAKEDPDRGPAG